LRKMGDGGARQKLAVAPPRAVPALPREVLVRGLARHPATASENGAGNRSYV
jgi:hypothetical protein